MKLQQIKKWTFDKRTHEIVFYYIDNCVFKELATMPFTIEEYNKLPKDDLECLLALIDKYQELNNKSKWNGLKEYIKELRKEENKKPLRNYTEEVEFNTFIRVVQRIENKMIVLDKMNELEGK